MSKQRSIRIHKTHKKTRQERFAKGVYGEVKAPVFDRSQPCVWDLPSYLSSKNTARWCLIQKKSDIDRKLDLRCFFSGIECNLGVWPPPPGWNHAPLVTPWLGSRDHLVPARRGVDSEAQYVNYPSTMVWSSNLINTTLGLAPLAVRLKVRRWLQTTQFPRANLSQEQTENIRWIVIHYLDWFRIKGRYPWSRTKQNTWWYPEISEPFMQRMQQIEREFLELDHLDRNSWINEFDWQF